MEEETVIAPGAYRNKMNARVRNKSRELEKMKRDLVKFVAVYICLECGTNENRINKMEIKCLTLQNKITSGFQASSARDDLLSTGPKEFDPNVS
jgi:hypothetical protein